MKKRLPTSTTIELVEVTPTAIRLRKRYLDPHERKRMAKAS